MQGRTSGDLDIPSKSNRTTLSRSLSSKATPLQTRGRGFTLTPTTLLCKHIRIVIIFVEPKQTLPKRSKLSAMCHSYNSSHQLATILVWDRSPSRASTSARLCSSAPRHACSRSSSTSSSSSISSSPPTSRQSSVSKTRSPVVPGEVGSRKSAAQKTEKAATRGEGQETEGARRRLHHRRLRRISGQRPSIHQLLHLGRSDQGSTLQAAAAVDGSAVAERQALELSALRKPGAWGRSALPLLGAPTFYSTDIKSCIFCTFSTVACLEYFLRHCRVRDRPMIVASQPSAVHSVIIGILNHSLSV